MTVRCPLCEGPLIERVASRDFTRPDDKTEWRVGWCDSCEFGRVTNDVDEATIASFYPKNYYTHGAAFKPVPRTFLDRAREFIAARLDRTINFSPDEVTGKTVCDVGCGDGSVLRKFHQAGFEVVGVEPDPAARAKCSGLVVYEGTAEKMPPLNRKYDAVVLSHSLEHCNDPMAALRSCSALLDRNGTIVIEVPNNAAVGFQMFGAAWPWADIPRHLNFFTEKSLRIALSACGLSVTRVIYCGYWRQFTSWWLSLLHQAGGYNSAWSWWLLLRTAYAPPSRGYDSIRVHAQLIYERGSIHSEDWNKNFTA